MKKIGLIILAGIIPVIVLALFMNFLSQNLISSFMLAVVVLLGTSYWQASSPNPAWLKVLIISAPLTLVYYILIVGQITGMWVALPFFVLAVIIGTAIKANTLKLTLALGLLLSSGLVAYFYFPKVISQELSQTINEQAPDYEIENLLADGHFKAANHKGKVVVLDFFGTWCAPCIAEMSELKKIKQSLSQYEDDVLFVLACTEQGGDTPEKAITFHSKRQLPFELGFDAGSKAHQSFGFTGVPGLVIIDKEGQMRFKHEGFNPAEDLPAILLPVIEQLLAE